MNAQFAKQILSLWEECKAYWANTPEEEISFYDFILFIENKANEV